MGACLTSSYDWFILSSLWSFSILENINDDTDSSAVSIWWLDISDEYPELQLCKLVPLTDERQVHADFLKSTTDWETGLLALDREIKAKLIS